MRANFVLSGVSQGIRRNLSMTVALILSTSIALAFAGAAILANQEIVKFRDAYESKLNVSVYLCPPKFSPKPCTGGTTAAQKTSIEKQLNADPRVSGTVTSVSADEAYANAKKTNSKRVAGLIERGTLPPSFTVKLKDIDNDFASFNKTYSAKPGVSAVSNQIKAIHTLLDAINGARLFSIGIAIVVLIASILLISNTIQVAAAQRKNETSIMRLVGASRWMAELPFMLETIFATIIGGLIGFGLTTLGKFIVLNKIFDVQVDRGVIPGLSLNDVLVGSGIALIGGVVLAALTAFATLRLYVKL